MRRLATAVLVAAGAGLALGPAGSGAAGPGEPRAGASVIPYGPRVQVMVVGRTRLWKAATFVYSRPFTALVAGRRCAVVGGTPLATLEAARRLAGPSFHLRDFGACSLRPAESSGLFVDRVGFDYNRGRDGWVYKVDRRAGTASAGGLAGPFGTGRRLRAGQRVTWFYCRLGFGGCQRTLDLYVPVRRPAAGSQLAVHVHSYDDLARGHSAAGATVSLAGARAVTDAGGNATLPVPATSGPQRVYAGQPGLVPAFPVDVFVP